MNHKIQDQMDHLHLKELMMKVVSLSKVRMIDQLNKNLNLLHSIMGISNSHKGFIKFVKKCFNYELLK